MKETGSFKSSGEGNLRYTVWAPEKPWCVLQIIHGMCEYMGRYEPLAEYLNTFGIAVGGDDHLGHGESSDPKDFGYFGEKDGAKHLIEDEERMRGVLSKRFEGLPYFILGHSMGSMILRCYLASHGEGLAGAVIEGTSGKNPAVGLGIALAKFIKLFKGGRGKSRVIDGLAFGSYEKGLSKSAWITRDEKIVEKYIADPFCRFKFTLSGYIDLFTLLRDCNTDAVINDAPKALPLFIASGSEDPVGNFGKGASEVFSRYKGAGCDAELKIYDGMRHELHNEIGKESFLLDLKNFILASL